MRFQSFVAPVELLRAPSRAWQALRQRLTTPHLPGRRLPLMIAAHSVLIVASAYFALELRFDPEPVPRHVVDNFVGTLGWLIAIRTAVFIPFGLYGGLWRYTGIWDLSRIIAAVVVSSAAMSLFVYQPLGSAAFPRGVIVIDSLLLISILSGVRIARRVAQAAPRSRKGQRMLVIGAGDAGEMIVREMHRVGGYNPVGFIDDNRSKVGSTIHGVTVYGTRADLSRVIAATDPQEILVAIPSAGAEAVRSLVQLLEPYKLPISTLPDLKQLVAGKVGVKHIRPLAIEDLLPRSPVSLDVTAVRQLVRGKRVVVTGAGGSIGSELCRQVAALEPASLVLFERYENSLFSTLNDLLDSNPKAEIHPVIGDVTDWARVDAVFGQHRPHLVFHAAAHKHVPLMEANPCEAVKNNVVGTQTIAEASRRHGAERFVLISTDKAANPSSVMGATKRVAELIVQSMSDQGPTRYVTVRFGNVLGSNGSVIPRLVSQIRSGGPVTVTHPEMRRYFMLIPEAVELVLQSAVLGRRCETFVLDMGEQLKVLDVARNLIRLSGFVPGEDITIKFIGLRPGEKLTEELVGQGEILEPADVSKIFRVRWPEIASRATLSSQVETLVAAAVQGRPVDTIAQLHRLLPTFTRPEPLVHASVETEKVVEEPAPRQTAHTLRTRIARPFARAKTLPQA